MNDFTKEELEYISDCIDYGLPDKARNDAYIYLDNKLQSMIENYCEHSFRMHPVKGFPLERIVKCTNCGVEK